MREKCNWNTSIYVICRVSPISNESPDERNLRLEFKSKLALPLFTGSKVEAEGGSGIQVVLVDANTGQVLSEGEESCSKLDVVVLQGDFTANDDENWPQADFETFVVKEREGKRPLLTGDLSVTLKDGLGTLGEFQFTDNSSWIRSRKFRLGIMVSPGYCEGVRIREAKTDSFTVKDHRGECKSCWPLNIYFWFCVTWSGHCAILSDSHECVGWFPKKNLVVDQCTRSTIPQH